MYQLVLTLQELLNKSAETIKVLRQENAVLKSQVQTLQSYLDSTVESGKSLANSLKTYKEKYEELYEICKDSQMICDEALQQRDAALSQSKKTRPRLDDSPYWNN